VSKVWYGTLVPGRIVHENNKLGYFAGDINGPSGGY